MISGTTGLLGCADGALVLQKSSRMETTATLDVTGREVADTQLKLRFDKQKKIWEFVSFGNDAPQKEPNPILTAVQVFIRERHEWIGYAAELLAELKAHSELEAEPHTLTRLMNAHITELANEYGVLYRSGKRTGKGRRVYLKDIHEDYAANVGNDAISDSVAGGENTCNSYITVTDGQEGA